MTNTRPIQSNSSAIEPNRTPIIQFNRTQSNIVELTIKFCQSNTIEHSITERLVIEPNRTFDYRTIGISNVRLTNAASHDRHVVLENSEGESEITANSLPFLRCFCWALKPRTEMSAMSNTEEREDTSCIEITCSVKGYQECNFTVDVVIEITFYLFCFVRTLTFLQYDVQFLVIQ